MKKLGFLLIALLLLAPLSALAVFDNFGFGENWGLSSASPAAVVVSVINLVLTFLGLITLVMVIYGGFLYLLARGNAETASKGRKVIVFGVIGLAVVLASWGVSYFVFTQINTAIGEAGSGTAPGGGGFACQQAGGQCQVSCNPNLIITGSDCSNSQVCCAVGGNMCEKAGCSCISVLSTCGSVGLHESKMLSGCATEEQCCCP